MIPYLAYMPLSLPHFKRSTIIIFTICIAVLAYPLCVGALSLMGYHVLTEDAQITKREALAEAIKKQDVTICKKIIIPFPYMGPSAGDLSNGCYLGYIHATNDISLCKHTISAASCITAAARRMNDPELCKKAFFTEGNRGDDRGSCFGYFAAQERDISYCEQLAVKGMPKVQKRICLAKLIDVCHLTDSPAKCYTEAAVLREDITVCKRITQSALAEKCRASFE